MPDKGAETPGQPTPFDANQMLYEDKSTVSDPLLYNSMALLKLETSTYSLIQTPDAHAHPR